MGWGRKLRCLITVEREGERGRWCVETCPERQQTKLSEAWKLKHLTSQHHWSATITGLNVHKSLCVKAQVL